MNKIIESSIGAILFYILPVLVFGGNPLDFKVIFLVLMSIVVFQTQPSIETSKDASTGADRNTMWFIIIGGLVSSWAVMIEWSLSPAESNSSTQLGALLVIYGVVFRGAAIKTLNDYFTAKVKIQPGQKLITQGPYETIRHPSYTGAYLAFIGAAWYMSTPIALCITILIMGWAYYQRIEAEEDHLSQHLSGYKEYQTTTKRLIPYIW